MMVFIDSTEFAKNPYVQKLRWDRLAEWRDCDFARIVVQIYKTIFDFGKDHVKPRMKRRDDLIDAMNNGTHPFDANQLFANQYDVIFEALSDFIEPWGEFPSHFNTPEFDSPQLAELSTVPEHFQIDSLDICGNQFILFVTYGVDGIVRCKSKHGEPDGYRTRRVSFQIHASVVLDMETREVDDCEINEDFFYSLWPEEWRIQEGPSDEAEGRSNGTDGDSGEDE